MKEDMCVFVWLDFVQWTVAISLLCQPWQGEGKQKGWPLLTWEKNKMGPE